MKTPHSRSTVAGPGLSAALVFGGIFGLASAPAGADGPHDQTGFSFAAAGCAQTVSNIQAPAERVKPYLDPRFECSREELGACMVAYRMFSCPALSIDGADPRPVVWTELGVRAKPPHGIPNTDHIDTHAMDGHDYYMIFFHTNDAALAQRFADAGMPGHLVSDLTFSLPGDGVPAPFEGVEIDPGGGTWRVRAEALLPHDASLLGAEVVLATGAFPPFHLNAYYVRDDGRIARYQEYRTAVTGHLSGYRIEHDEKTLLAGMTGRSETTFSDAVVLFDVEAAVEVFEDAACVFDPTCNPANLPALPQTKP